MWRKFLLLILIFNTSCSSNQQKIDVAVLGTLTALPTNTPVLITVIPSSLPTLTLEPTLTPPVRLDLIGNTVDKAVKELESYGYVFEYYQYETGNSRYLGSYKNLPEHSVILDIRQYNFVSAGYSIVSGVDFDAYLSPDVLYTAVLGKDMFNEKVLPWKNRIIEQAVQNGYTLVDEQNLLCFDGYVLFENYVGVHQTYSIYLRQDWEEDVLKDVYGVYCDD